MYSCCFVNSIKLLRSPICRTSLCRYHRRLGNFGSLSREEAGNSVVPGKNLYHDHFGIADESPKNAMPTLP